MTLLVTLKAIFITALYALACLNLGAWSLRRADVAQTSGLATRFALAFSLGQGIFACLWLLVALAGWLYPTLTLPVLALALLLGLAPHRKLRATPSVVLGRELMHAIPRALATLSRPERWLALGTLLTATLYVLQSLAPFPQGDAVAYYLVVAKITALTGKLGLSWFNYVPTFTFFGEGHFAVLYQLAGESAMLWFDSLIAVNLLLAIYALGQQVNLSIRGRLVSILIFLSTSAFTSTIGGGKLDITGAQFGVSAVLACFAALETVAAPHGRWLVLGAALTAFSVMAKVSNALLGPVIGLAFLHRLRQPKTDPKAVLRAALVFGVAAAVFLIPLFLKNWLMLGQPFVPFLPPRTADGPIWTGGQLRQALSLVHAQRTLSNLDLALLPFVWTFANRDWMAGNISPLYLGLLPGFLGRRPVSQVRLLVWMGLLALAIWFVVSPWTLQTRYHFIGLALLTTPFGWLAAQWLHDKSWRRWALIALVLTLVISLVNARKVRLTLAYLRGQIDRATLFTKHSWMRNAYSFAALVNERVPQGERVYLARGGWYYTYFLDDRILRAAQQPDEALAAWKAGFTPETWQHLYAGGFRWFMLNKNPEQRDDPQPNDLRELPPELHAKTIVETADTLLIRLEPTL